MTSGHRDGNACGQIWLFWELGGLWPQRYPHLGEGAGSGGLRAPFLGTAPPCPFLMEGHFGDRG